MRQKAPEPPWQRHSACWESGPWASLLSVLLFPVTILRQSRVLLTEFSQAAPGWDAPRSTDWRKAQAATSPFAPLSAQRMLQTWMFPHPDSLVRLCKQKTLYKQGLAKWKKKESCQLCLTYVSNRKVHSEPLTMDLNNGSSWGRNQIQTGETTPKVTHGCEEEAG